MSGLFITFEGNEGSGKSTQIRELADFLRGKGYEVVLTREPGGTPIGDQVRQILLDHANNEMHPRTEVLLFLASRAQHVEQLIRPALEAGKIVLCDRYADSTLAYQGYGRGENVAKLRELIDYATGNLWPDLTIWLDLPVEKGLARLKRKNRLDGELIAFHQRVRDGYRRLAEAEPARWVRFDGTLPRDELQKQISEVVMGKIRELGIGN